MTSAYVVCHPYRLWGRDEKFSRAEKRVSDIHVAFRFSAKLTILGATNGVALVKVLCSAKDKKFGKRVF